MSVPVIIGPLNVQTPGSTKKGRRVLHAYRGRGPGIPQVGYKVFCVLCGKEYVGLDAPHYWIDEAHFHGLGEEYALCGTSEADIVSVMLS